MNYFRFYVGDYLKDTSKLSLIEHGAYSQMLAYYYAEEAPLPLDKVEIYTMVRAMTPADRKAVDKLLRNYFKAELDGYHNARADHEIAVSRKARDNGARGGRPQTGSETGLVTGSVTGAQTGLVTGQGGGSGHPPTTNHQPPAFQPPEKAKSTVGLAPDDAPHKGLNGHDTDKTKALRAEAVQILIFLNEQTGRSYEPVPENIDRIVARLKGGTSADDVRSVIAMKCREWGKDEKMVKFLRPKTLFAAENFANYKGELVNV